MEREIFNRPEEEQILSKSTFHHSRNLEYSSFGIVKQKMGVDPDYEGAYRWLEKEVGFAPLFLAVGKIEEDIRMTGYQNQWRKLLVRGLNNREYRHKGDTENQVLFSFNDLPGGRFMDYASWHIVLNSGHKNYKINSWARKLIFRETWDKEKWISHAAKNPGSVQYVVPELDLRKADSIWVRNKETQKNLEKRGFQNVAVKRLAVDRW